jgi:hypothetical protein
LGSVELIKSGGSIPFGGFFASTVGWEKAGLAAGDGTGLTATGDWVVVVVPPPPNKSHPVVANPKAVAMAINETWRISPPQRFFRMIPG